MSKKCSLKLLFSITGVVVTFVLLFLLGYYISDNLKEKENLTNNKKCGLQDNSTLGGNKNWPPPTFKKLPDGITCKNVAGSGHGSMSSDHPKQCMSRFFKEYPNSKQGILTFGSLAGTPDAGTEFHNCYWNDLSNCFQGTGLYTTTRDSNITQTGYYLPGFSSENNPECSQEGTKLLNSQNVGANGCKGHGFGRFQFQDTTNVPVVQYAAFKHSWSGACEDECNSPDCYGYLFDTTEIDKVITTDSSFSSLSQIKNNNCFLFKPTSYNNNNAFEGSSICSQGYNQQGCDNITSKNFSWMDKMLKNDWPDTIEDSGTACSSRCSETPGCVGYRYFMNYPKGLGPWKMGAASASSGQLCRLFGDNAGDETEGIYPASNTCLLIHQSGSAKGLPLYVSSTSYTAVPPPPPPPPPPPACADNPNGYNGKPCPDYAWKGAIKPCQLPGHFPGLPEKCPKTCGQC